MTNKIIQTANYLDWVSPLAATVQDAIAGDAYVLHFDEAACQAAGYSPQAVSDLLRGNGVDNWGLVFAGEEFMLSVHRGRAFWAQLVLQRAGVMLLYPVLPQTRKAKGQGWLSWLWECIRGG